MTPLLGTKTPSAPAGDKSGGDRRAARSLLSCALWRGMGGYGAAWAAWGAPSHCSRTIRTSNMTIRVFTKHETRLLPDARQVPARIPRFSRDTNHGLYAFLPTISHDFPVFPAILRPPSPPGNGVRAPSAVLGGFHDKRREQRPPPPSGMLPMRRTRNEFMLRKENVQCALKTTTEAAQAEAQAAETAIRESS